MARRYAGRSYRSRYRRSRSRYSRRSSRGGSRRSSYRRRYKKRYQRRYKRRYARRSTKRRYKRRYARRSRKPKRSSKKKGRKSKGLKGWTFLKAEKKYAKGLRAGPLKFDSPEEVAAQQAQPIVRIMTCSPTTYKSKLKKGNVYVTGHADRVFMKNGKYVGYGAAATRRKTASTNPFDSDLHATMSAKTANALEKIKPTDKPYDWGKKLAKAGALDGYYTDGLRDYFYDYYDERGDVMEAIDGAQSIIGDSDEHDTELVNGKWIVPIQAKPRALGGKTRRTFDNPFWTAGSSMASRFADAAADELVAYGTNEMRNYRQDKERSNREWARNDRTAAARGLSSNPFDDYMEL